MIKIPDTEKARVQSEISDCQGRILKVLMPTLLSLGAISLAKVESSPFLTLASAFAVLFSSSLYIASLSYKIFRNATFLKVLIAHAPDQTNSWEDALIRFNGLKKPPFFIGYETRTIGFIYLIFAACFYVMFKDVAYGWAIGLGLAIACIAARILLIPTRVTQMTKQWEDSLCEMSDKP